MPYFMISLYCCVYTGVLCTDLCILKNRCIEEDGLVIFCSGGCSVSSLNRIMLSNTLSHRFSDTKVTGNIGKITKTLCSDFPHRPVSKQQRVISGCYAEEKRPDMTVDLQMQREGLEIKEYMQIKG